MADLPQANDLVVHADGTVEIRQDTWLVLVEVAASYGYRAWPDLDPKGHWFVRENTGCTRVTYFNPGVCSAMADALERYVGDADDGNPDNAPLWALVRRLIARLRVGPVLLPGSEECWT